MRNVGFICEGATERKIVESDNFKALLASYQLELITPVIDATGKSNVHRNKIDAHVKILKANGAEIIIVITDLDDDACITKTKEAVGTDKVDLIIVAVKQIEAWFLADSDCMSAICKTTISYEFPENPVSPFDEIKALLIAHTGRGVGDKILLASRCLGNSFSIGNAAVHPNCPSAKYFVEKLSAL
jgi:hypothetical protein